MCVCLGFRGIFIHNLHLHVHTSLVEYFSVHKMLTFIKDSGDLCCMFLVYSLNVNCIIKSKK